MMPKGRKRRAGPRYTCGKRKRTQANDTTDQGASRVQVRREWWVTYETAKGEVMTGDLALADYPLGTLYTNGSINDDMWRAGSRYAWLYCARVGRSVHVTATALDPLPPGKDEDTAEQQDRRARWGQEFHAAQAALGGRRALRDALENLVVYERIPRWMRPQVPRESDIQEARMVLEALTMLASHFGYGQRRAA
jgi:hypothetical protein